jgi:CubicO group peptidase (beta-lactamase class C family)
VLGYLVEVVSGMALDRFLAERIFEPLEMGDTYFYLPADRAGRLAALYGKDEDGRLERYTAERMNEDKFNATPDYPIEGARTYFSGGAGLSSTAADYARFLQMLLNGGELEGTRLLSPKTVELMTVDHTGHREGIDFSFGLGFGIGQALGRQGEIGSAGTYDWGGYWGTSFWVDPREQLIGILLTQANPSDYNHGRFRALVYQAITETAAEDPRYRQSAARSK